MRVYHFTAAVHAISDVRNRRLKIARIDDLNDPFELLSQDLSNSKWRDAFLRIKTQASRKLGFLCFSPNFSNPLMWAHYADRHRGVVLGFDVPESKCQRIKYSTMRSNAIRQSFETGEDPTQSQIIDWLNTKFEGWNYEKEIRLVCLLDSASVIEGHYFSAFSNDLVLREIVVGVAASLETFRELQQLSDGKVSVSRAELSETTFDVITAETRPHIGPAQTE
jgi:hypothetical protein